MKDPILPHLKVIFALPSALKPGSPRLQEPNPRPHPEKTGKIVQKNRSRHYMTRPSFPCFGIRKTDLVGTTMVSGSCEEWELALDRLGCSWLRRPHEAEVGTGEPSDVGCHRREFRG